MTTFSIINNIMVRLEHFKGRCKGISTTSSTIFPFNNLHAFYNPLSSMVEAVEPLESLVQMADLFCPLSSLLKP